MKIGAAHYNRLALFLTPTFSGCAPPLPTHRPASSARVVKKKSKRLATSIFSASQRRNVGTVWQPFQTISQYSYDAMLR